MFQEDLFYKSKINNNKENNKKTYNSKHFFIIFLIFSFVFAFLIGGLILGNQNSKKQLSTTINSEQIKIQTNQIPDNPNNWKVYQLKNLGLEIKLPDKLSNQGEWKEFKIKNEKGTITCFSNKTPSSICEGKVLTIGSSSSNYKNGKNIMFTELQGFNTENEIYSVKISQNNLISLKNLKVKEFPNVNGLKILKIIGTSINDTPTPGTPGEGYLGAIVNTNNSKYPGLSIQYSIEESDLTEYEFDQIINSIEPIN
jgi:hypothetical protein